jgi:hypothetical protein
MGMVLLFVISLVLLCKFCWSWLEMPLWLLVGMFLGVAEISF